MNYTKWLDEVEQRAIKVNARRFEGITIASPTETKTRVVREAFAYLQLFNCFVSLNRQILFAHKQRASNVR